MGAVGMAPRSATRAASAAGARSGFFRVSPCAPHPYPSPQRGGGSPEREHRVDEIVPRALLAEMDLQAVGKEGEEIGEHNQLV